MIYDFVHTWSGPVELISTWATLAVDIYRNTNHYEDANGRHLFATSITRVFETMRLRINLGLAVTHADETTMPLTSLLSHMADALRWSLVHSQSNCGAYVSLPWVEDIARCYQAAHDSGHDEYKDSLAAIPLTGDPTLRPTFLLILRLLQTCFKRGLLTGSTTRKDLKQLTKLLALRPTLSDLPAQFQEEVLARRANNARMVRRCAEP